MELKDCKEMADNIRIALNTFTKDTLDIITTDVISSTNPLPNFQPLYDTLSGTLEDIKAAQSRIDAVKGIPASPVTIVVPISSTDPVVIDGPVIAGA